MKINSNLCHTLQPLNLKFQIRIWQITIEMCVLLFFFSPNFLSFTRCLCLVRSFSLFLRFIPWRKAITLRFDGDGLSGSFCFFLFLFLVNTGTFSTNTSKRVFLNEIHSMNLKTKAKYKI